MKRIAVVALGIALGLGACTADAPPKEARPVPAAIAEPVKAASAGSVVELKRFDSCEQVLSYARRETMKTVGPYGLDELYGFPGLDAMPGMAMTTSDTTGEAVGARAAAAPMPQATSNSTATYSGTNVQEAGVDEPDIVKTDGKRIIAVARGRLHHVSIRDGRPRVTDSLKLKEGAGDLLMHGDRIIVISHAYEQAEFDARGRRVKGPIFEGMSTVITLVDISDPDDIRRRSSVRLEGSYVSARSIEGVARIVLRTSPELTGFTYPRKAGKAARNRAEARNRDVVAGAGIDAWRPSFVREGSSRPKPLVRCEDIRRPARPAGVGMVTVVTMSGNDLKPRDATSVFASAEHIYASENSLTIAANEWIAPTKISLGRTITQLHRFDISDPDKTVYRASGRVRGTLLNQFSMSEHDGYLRVATTEEPTFGRRGRRRSVSESRVTILKEVDRRLERVGLVKGLGKDERIYSVRFIGELGYVVTFRQVDPLYVIDLADPTSPRVRGELKISGYSAYLHPVGDDLLLGVGQDATLEGQTLGTQVSLFDVGSPAAPKLLDRITLGRSASAAEYDHHAFLYWEPTGLIVLPMQIYGDGNAFTGAVALRLDGRELQKVGRISHPADRPEPELLEPDLSYRPQIDRTLVIDDRLYSTSRSGVEAVDLDTLRGSTWASWRE